MALESYCAACTYMGENADYEGKYYCERKGERRYASDAKCYSFCEAYSRSRYTRENMYENSKSHQSSGCYLTTAMCNILNYPDDNYYLQTLRTFRDTILKQNFKYIPLLLSYDIIGPQIAYELEKDENKVEIATNLFNKFITASVVAIENNKTQDAINIYTAMTQSLAEKYNINTNILITNPNKININELGHGKTRKKIITENI
jgi:hypothetical protein